MLKTFLASLAALVVLAGVVSMIIFGARSVPVPVQKENHQACLDYAKATHANPINCPKTETLWDRGFEDPVAYYTLWLALFTVALAIGALAQSVLVGRQISLARDEFNATFRPKIRVLNISLDWRSEDEAGLLDTADQSFEAFIKFVNEGQTTATITAIKSVLTKDPYGILVYKPKDFPHVEVVSGEEGTYPLTDGFVKYWVQPGVAKHLIGEIAYQDSAKRFRKTGFHWRFGDINGRGDTFTRMDDSPFEYSY